MGSSQYDRITERFEKLKTSLNFHGEVKWSKVTHAYLGKYQSLMIALFDEVRTGNLKIRIMFRQNAHVATHLTKEQIDGAYFLLYYQFIKGAFGFKYRDVSDGDAFLRLYFDAFPATRESVKQFKGYIHALGGSQDFRNGGIYLREEDITEVSSHDHVLLQMLDIVLGAMNFRLNDLHKIKPEGSRTRGKRTIAKEKLYKTILAEIHTVYPRLNIGTSTGTVAGPHVKWTHPYRHWCFIPKKFSVDPTQFK